MIYTRTSCISSAALFLHNFVISCFAYLKYKCIFHGGRIWFILITIWKTLTSQMKKNRLKLLSPKSLINYSNMQKSYGRGRESPGLQHYHIPLKIILIDRYFPVCPFAHRMSPLPDTNLNLISLFPWIRYMWHIADCAVKLSISRFTQGLPCRSSVCVPGHLK